MNAKLSETIPGRVNLDSRLEGDNLLHYYNMAHLNVNIIKAVIDHLNVHLYTLDKGLVIGNAKELDIAESPQQMDRKKQTNRTLYPLPGSTEEHGIGYQLRYQAIPPYNKS